MKVVTTILSTVLMLLVAPSPAWSMLWGAGMWGGLQHCGYEVKESEEAASIKEELEEREKELREARSELRKLKSKTSTLRSTLKSRKDLFKMSGFEGEAFSFLDNHITIGRSCKEYAQVRCPGVSYWQNLDSRMSRMPASGPDGFAPRPGRRVVPALPAPQEGECLDPRDPACRRSPPVTAEPNPEPPAIVPIGDGPRPVPSPVVVTPAPLPTPAPVVTPPYEPEPVYDYAPAPVPAPRVGRPTRPVVTVPTEDPCGSGNLVDTAPFEPEVWSRLCGPEPGDVRDQVCDQNIPGSRPKTYSSENCKKHLRAWIDKQKELRENETKIAELELKVKELEAIVKMNKIELREARKEYQREMRERMSEGECVDCMVQQGTIIAPRKPTGWEIAANVALGLGSMYLGNKLNQYAIDSNAKLGFPTQPYPAFGYGFPYFMGALYGALGGSLGYGGFGCFGGVMGPYGAMGPMGMGGVYGPMGGAFGYPPWAWGPGMSGGIFLPGMGPFGMPGPWGGAMCITWPCPVGPGMGMMVGGGIGMMMPGMGMMAPGMMMPGMMAGGGIGMMMPGMGMMAPGMMMPGMMAGGGIGMMMPGMGMMDGGLGAMQMQMAMAQQMMQMQMQYYQQMMQVQQQRMQQYMAQQQVIAGLTQELYTLLFRLQQAQMGLYTGGYGPLPITGPGYPSPIPPGGPVVPTPVTPGPVTPGPGGPGAGGPPSYR